MSVAHHFDVNWLAIAAAGVVSHAIGTVWFSPLLLGKAYSEELKTAKINTNVPMLLPIGGTMIGNLVKAYGISRCIKYLVHVHPKTSSLVAGLQVAIAAFVSFIVPTRLSGVFWAGQSWRFFGITAAQDLATSLAMGAVIGYLG